MKIFLSVFLICFAVNVFSQTINYDPDSIQTKIDNSALKVFLDNKIIYQKKFFNPSLYIADLDNDGLNEYLVTDSTFKNNKPFFTIFIYSALDSFYLVDSIESGYTEPYISDSADTGKIIIITGNPDFDQFNNNDSTFFVPINCWVFQNSSIFLANDEVYDLFLSENDNIINYLDDYFSSNPKNCSSSEKIKAAVAAGYANYLNAGENSIASQFLKKYYLCDDINNFKAKLNSLLEGN